MTVREMLNSASDDAIASAILRGAFKKCAYCIYDDALHMKLASERVRIRTQDSIAERE